MGPRGGSVLLFDLMQVSGLRGCFPLLRVFGLVLVENGHRCSASVKGLNKVVVATPRRSAARTPSRFQAGAKRET